MTQRGQASPTADSPGPQDPARTGGVDGPRAAGRGGATDAQVDGRGGGPEGAARGPTGLPAGLPSPLVPRGKRARRGRRPTGAEACLNSERTVGLTVRLGVGLCVGTGKPRGRAPRGHPLPFRGSLKDWGRGTQRSPACLEPTFSLFLSGPRTLPRLDDLAPDLALAPPPPPSIPVEHFAREETRRGGDPPSG